MVPARAPPVGGIGAALQLRNSGSQGTVQGAAMLHKVPDEFFMPALAHEVAVLA
jgi:hypothetical protein